LYEYFRGVETDIHNIYFYDILDFYEVTMVMPVMPLLFLQEGGFVKQLSGLFMAKQFAQLYAVLLSEYQIFMVNKISKNAAVCKKYLSISHLQLLCIRIRRRTESCPTYTHTMATGRENWEPSSTACWMVICSSR